MTQSNQTTLKAFILMSSMATTCVEATPTKTPIISQIGYIPRPVPIPVSPIVRGTLLAGVVSAGCIATAHGGVVSEHFQLWRTADILKKSDDPQDQDITPAVVAGHKNDMLKSLAKGTVGAGSMAYLIKTYGGGNRRSPVALGVSLALIGGAALDHIAMLAPQDTSK